MSVIKRENAFRVLYKLNLECPRIFLLARSTDSAPGNFRKVVAFVARRRNRSPKSMDFTQGKVSKLASFRFFFGCVQIFTSFRRYQKSDDLI